MGDDGRLTVLPRLNVGCGTAIDRGPGWINCDMHSFEGVDRVFDLQGTWPFPPGSVGEVRASHVLEHVPDHMAFFRGAWRVLAPGGRLYVQVPYGWHSASWWDPTHLRPWFQESFAFVQPGYWRYSRNLQEQGPGFSFWVMNVIMVLALPWARWWRIKPLRRLMFRAGTHLVNFVKELHADMLKTEASDGKSTAFGGSHHPAVVPVCVGVWRHEYEGRPLTGDTGEIFTFPAPQSMAGF